MKPAISVRGLGKAYTISHQEKQTLASEALLAKLRNPFGKIEHETFWALRDVEFDIQQGDVVGIVGRNGAGKSTLLKVLSRITTPTTGEVRIFGRVGSLLEVGTGFHPELTGRENIFLNGAILGMRKSEITRQFDAITDFAEVEKFLDTPVKRYSSGMYVRLAFAVAAHLNPEILIVDEVLAVGDAQFQAKCLGKMQDVSRQGRTVLFVSHNMGVVRSLCQRGIMMLHGTVLLHDEIDPVIAAYTRTSSTALGKVVHRSHFGIKLVDIQVNDQHEPPYSVDFGTRVEVKLIFETAEATPLAIPYLRWRDSRELVVSETWGPEEGVDFQQYQGQFGFRLQIDAVNLMPGPYLIDIVLHDSAGKELFAAMDGLQIDVQPIALPGAPRAYDPRHGVLRIANTFDKLSPVPPL